MRQGRFQYTTHAATPPRDSGRVRSLMTLLISAGALSAAPGQPGTVVPQPASFEARAGALPIRAGFRIVPGGPCAVALGDAWHRTLHSLSQITGIPNAPAPASPALTMNCRQVSAVPIPLRGDESYTLAIDATGARLTAPRSAGLLRGLETFLQLVVLTPRGFEAPACRIADAPRFPWRGLMLDVARHFMPVNTVKHTLDGMAAVKLNVLHWHLSDGQGFRVESRVFPMLHRVGIEGEFYTREQVREVIAYASARAIRVVPEFDVPGHATAWLVHYPQLGSAPGPYQWERGHGIFDPVMDPTRESTYQFLDQFFAEMARLFPDPYLHIGGDENNGRQWTKSAPIQAFMNAQGLKDNAALHAYFNKRLAAIVRKHGKIMMGWDEILHPDLPKDALIQSWRGPKALAEAARLGYPVILSSGFYLDLMQSAAEHYDPDPLAGDSAALPPEARARVLGGEACMWTEFVDPANLDNRLWPRLAAVAERLWSPPGVRDVDSLYARLDALTLRMELQGFHPRSGTERMLRRMAGTSGIAPLLTLAGAVEPVKQYTRGILSHHEVTLPLNRLVDAVTPESLTARQFGRDVQATLGGDAAARRRVHATLIHWRDNHARLQPLLEGSAILSEVLPLSEALAATARAALEALDAAPLPPARATTARPGLEALDAAPLPPARAATLLAMLADAGLAPLSPKNEADCRAILKQDGDPADAIEKACTRRHPVAALLLVATPHIQALVRGKL